MCPVPVDGASTEQQGRDESVVSEAAACVKELEAANIRQVSFTLSFRRALSHSACTLGSPMCRCLPGSFKAQGGQESVG